MAAGVPRPRAEARHLLRYATGIGTSSLLSHPEAEVPDEGARSYRGWVGRRAGREPFAYIVGQAEFWSLDFVVGPAVLVPRADSETLIEAAIQRFADPGRPLRILDIGVGSGCLLLALLRHFPNAHGVGTDTSADALAVARLNAERLGLAARVRLELTPWVEDVDGPFDIVLSNPPYIPSADIAGLEPEVARFEPRAALDGGPDGLDAYRAILPALSRLLATDAAVFLEIGAGQESQIVPMAEPWFAVARTHPDLAGIARCLELAPRGC